MVDGGKRVSGASVAVVGVRAKVLPDEASGGMGGGCPASALASMDTK